MKLFSKTILAASMALAFGGAAKAAIIEVSGDITADTRWTRDNVYVLTGILYVLPPAKLTVEPGTLIRGANDTITAGTNNPGTICICRGAKIVGSGTVDDPIIFTSVDDPNVKGGANTIPATVVGLTYTTGLNYDVNGPTNNNAFAISRQAGGLVLLGRTPMAYDGNGNAARPSYNDSTNTFSGEALVLPTGGVSPEISGTAQNNAGDGTGFAVIEGLAILPATISFSFDSDQTVGYDPAEVNTWAGPEGAISGTVGGIAASTSFQRGVYGGVDENDDSGVVRFWSLRYGGFPVSADLEINGFTCGAVGRGTVSEWIDVINNADDAAEFFGGYNDCKYFFLMHCGDDYIDWDQGYSGTIQHVFIHSGGGQFFPRSGFTATDASTAGKNTTFNASERGFELDGPEPNNSGILPRSNGHVFNVTMIGPRGGVAVGAAHDGIRVRRASAGKIQYAIFEDIGSGVLEQSDPGNSTTVGSPTRNATSLLDSYYFNVAGTALVPNNGPAAGQTDIDVTGTVVTTAAQLVAKGQLVKNGLNPTLVDEAPSGTAIVARKLTRTAPTRAGVQNFLSPVTYTGAMRDNNMLFGWTGANDLQLLPTTNLARPVLSLTIVSGSPQVSFNADTTVTNAADSVQYVVERSSDGGATFVPFVAVQDGGSGDLDASAGTIRVADSISFTGAPVHYRVIPQ
ncbi:MAG: hypothetical protein NTV80_04895 [Verrucomicrobia bacterium]|nr:hypothetical protein [Verrucomicrobiota bacterium]